MTDIIGRLAFFAMGFDIIRFYYRAAARPVYAIGSQPSPAVNALLSIVGTDPAVVR